MKHVLTFLSALSVLLSATPEATQLRQPDTGVVPIVVTPSSSSISDGETVSLTVTLDHTATSNTSRSLSSSNSSLISVPTTVTVLNGHTTATFEGTPPPDQRLNTSSNVTLTASCNGGSATTVISVN